MNPRIALFAFLALISAGVASAACVDVSAQDLSALIAEAPSINTEIGSCSPPLSLGPFRRLVGGSGDLVIDVTTTSGTDPFTLSRTSGTVSGFSHSDSSSCRQRVTMSESTMDTILSSSDRVSQALFSFGRGDVTVSGCTLRSRVGLFFTRPIARFFARRTVSSAPPSAPAPSAASGRPDGCDDTYLPGHPGYAANQELWDSYSADADAVCQQNRGQPSGCVHTVQLSTSGTPYYLCWYNER